MAVDKTGELNRATGLLHNRNFILLCCAYGVSALGDHLSEMAILKTQNALDANVDITSISARMTFVFFVPFLLLAPLTGLLADRLPRRAVMVVADFSRVAVMLGFATLIAWSQSWGSWGPFAPLAVVGMFAAVFSPARSALLPTVIKPTQLVRANAIISGLGIIATMAAAKLGGYLADHYEPVIAFRYDAVTFIVSGCFLLLMSLPQRHKGDNPSKPRHSALEDIAAGLSYARRHRRVVELLLVATLVWFCGPLINSVIPAVVRDVYGGTFTTISNYRAFLGLGFIIGAVTVTMLGSALRSEIAMTWGLFGIAVGIGIFALSVFLPLEPRTLAKVGAIGIITAGTFAVAVMASFNSLLQRTVSNRFRGRVFGAKDMCCTAALLLATGILGIPKWERVDQWVGFILAGVSVATFVAGIVTLRVRLSRGAYGQALTFAENLNEFIAKFWWRMEREGPATVPRSGPVIVTANHTCSADPLFLSAAACYRPISFMVATEFTKWPIVRSFLKLVQCIPVKRDGRDTAATKKAIRHLREGNALGIFIEGRIVPPGESAKPKDGVAMLALKTNAVVIPVRIRGVTYHDSVVRGLISRHRARVRFGAPVNLDDLRSDHASRDDIREATKRIWAAINAL